MLALFLALQVCADSYHLRWLARERHVPEARYEAIAHVESACNLDPLLRGHACWRAHWHLRDCEVGRFQIKPSTGRARCRDLNIWTYKGNTECAARTLREDAQRYGLTDATIRHNGTGEPALEYLRKVLRQEEG